MPCILHSTSYIPHLTLHTLQPTIYTILSTSYSLRPTPYSLRPTPCALLGNLSTEVCEAGVRIRMQVTFPIVPSHPPICSGMVGVPRYFLVSSLPKSLGCRGGVQEGLKVRVQESRMGIRIRPHLFAFRSEAIPDECIVCRCTRTATTSGPRTCRGRPCPRVWGVGCRV